MPDVPIVKIVVLGFCSANFHQLSGPVGLIQWVTMQRLCNFEIDPSEDVSGWCIVMLRFSGSDLLRHSLLQRGVRQVHEVIDLYSCDSIIRKLLARRLDMLTAAEKAVSVSSNGNGHEQPAVEKSHPAIVTRRPMTFVVTDEPSERHLFDHDHRVRVVDSKRAQKDAFCGDLKAGDALFIGSVQDVALRSSLESLGAERGFRVACVPSPSALLQIVRERLAPPGHL